MKNNFILQYEDNKGRIRACRQKSKDVECKEIEKIDDLKDFLDS
ncbi:MAG: hypothetical protein ABEK36_01520 [Candidatus Aenigmatarchaeota archaeon]